MKANKAVRKSRQLVGKRREVGRPLVLLLSNMISSNLFYQIYIQVLGAPGPQCSVATFYHT